jgi:hypothetical protein
MKCDSWASLLAHTFTSLCFGREPKTKVATTRLWCKIVLKNHVEHIKGHEGFYFYLYPFGDVVQKSLQKGFYVRIE